MSFIVIKPENILNLNYKLGGSYIHLLEISFQLSYTYCITFCSTTFCSIKYNTMVGGLGIDATWLRPEDQHTVRSH